MILNHTGWLSMVLGQFPRQPQTNRRVLFGARLFAFIILHSVSWSEAVAGSVL